jgi:hypothetical protein
MEARITDKKSIGEKFGDKKVYYKLEIYSHF